MNAVKLLSKSQLIINKPGTSKSPSTRAFNFYLTCQDSDYKLCELKFLLRLPSLLLLPAMICDKLTWIR